MLAFLVEPHYVSILGGATLRQHSWWSHPPRETVPDCMASEGMAAGWTRAANKSRHGQLPAIAHSTVLVGSHSA